MEPRDQAPAHFPELEPAFHRQQHLAAVGRPDIVARLEVRRAIGSRPHQRQRCVLQRVEIAAVGDAVSVAVAHRSSGLGVWQGLPAAESDAIMPWPGRVIRATRNIDPLE
ncbi:hypothetical protein RADP37_05445 (plasmid) [Roseomonas mucosa]|uniref:Uncharacterized protein n=1 Tax=Roseomonas mucosa TaxID=207340 RepID=A0A4Y1MPZ2_9PROT|nr:hypothetical protein RADP37_05445 [Roseomonas mucosa]